jgi:hypothetical protein
MQVDGQLLSIVYQIAMRGNSPFKREVKHLSVTARFDKLSMLLGSYPGSRQRHTADNFGIRPYTGVQIRPLTGVQRAFETEADDNARVRV